MVVIHHSAQDEQKFKPGEIIRCWFCFRSTWAVYGPTMVCQSAGSCKTWYLRLPVTEDLEFKRWRCSSCNRAQINLKPHMMRCATCKHQDPIKRIEGIAAILEDGVRQHLRDEGELLPHGGPSFRRAKLTEPWTPRVDLPQELLTRRLRYYRQMEVKKSMSGRDVFTDYRRKRDTW